MKELGEQEAGGRKGLNEREKKNKRKNKNSKKNGVVGLMVDVKREGQRNWEIQ